MNKKNLIILAIILIALIASASAYAASPELYVAKSPSSSPTPTASPTSSPTQSPIITPSPTPNPYATPVRFLLTRLYQRQLHCQQQLLRPQRLLHRPALLLLTVIMTLYITASSDTHC